MNNVLTGTIILSSVIAIFGNAIHNYDYPRYAFNYAVNDPQKKDHKSQWEERDGDKVKGGYSLLEPDGRLRVVEYSANDLTGFNAVVKKFGRVQNPQRLHDPLFNSKYGFGAAPVAMELPQVKLSGATLPWDSGTASYGGWVSLAKGAHITIIHKKYVNGNLRKVIFGPISLSGRNIVIKKPIS